MAGQSWAVIAYLASVGFIAGLSRGFSGFGAALIFIPLAGAAVGPRTAAPILMLIDIFGALPMLPWAWRRAEPRTALMLAIGAAVAIPLGAMALTGLDPISLRWGISLTILALVGLLASGWRYAGKPHLAVTIGVGGVSGFLSGAAQIGGPPVVAYLLGRAAATAQDTRANIVLYFAYASLASLVTYLAKGLIDARVILISVAVVPGYVGGTVLGGRMFGLASQQTFRRICYALIAAAAMMGLPLFH